MAGDAAGHELIDNAPRICRVFHANGTPAVTAAEQFLRCCRREAIIAALREPQLVETTCRIATGDFQTNYHGRNWKRLPTVA
jgi:hypothetical protein